MLRVSSSSDPPTSSNVPPAQLSRHESTTSSHVAAECISQAETQTWPRRCPEPAEYAASSAHTTSCLVDSSSSSAATGRADEASFSMQQRRAVGNTTVTRAGVVGEKSLSTERDRPSTLGGGVKATCAEVPEQQMPPLPRNAAEQTEPALGPGAEKTVALSNCTEGWIRWHRPQATTPPGAQREPLGVTITPAAEKPRRNTRQAARLPVGRTAKAAAKAASEGKSQIFPGDQSLPEEQRSVCSDATELSSTAHPELMALLQFADEMDLTDILQCC
ncbi:hypothetical protein AB1Y20_004868 [Prymnesium parvum]|uniref:Uncharacterized protein n=1 Tax=Prymnesium parvum TaxID=97485 RepID=A0AB34J0F4_PRYPA